MRACLDMVWLRILTFDVCWHSCCHVCSFGGSEFGVHAWLDGDCVKRRLVCFSGCVLTRITESVHFCINFAISLYVKMSGVDGSLFCHSSQDLRPQ